MITSITLWLQHTWATLITDVQQHAALILVSAALICLVGIISWNTLSPIKLTNGDEDERETSYW